MMSDDEFDALEAELYLKVVAMLANNPPDPARYGRMACGYFNNQPPPGSQRRRCSNCGEGVMLGPKMLAKLRNPKLGLRVCVSCVPCV